jgi:hypothetical protein
MGGWDGGQGKRACVLGLNKEIIPRHNPFCDGGLKRGAESRLVVGLQEAVGTVEGTEPGADRRQGQRFTVRSLPRTAIPERGKQISKYNRDYVLCESVSERWRWIGKGKDT